MEDEELSTEEILEIADDKIDALINLLVKKGVFTEGEFEAEYDSLYEDEPEDEAPNPVQ